MHGGKSLRGVDHPRYRTGRYSKDVLVAGGKLGAAFQAHMKDPDRESLAAEQALLRANISQLITRGGELTDADWTKIKHSVDILGRITRTELKRLELAQENLSAKEAAALFSAMQTAVLDEVQDTEIRRRIAARMRLILTAGPHAVPALKLLREEAPGKTAIDRPVVVIEPDGIR